jgi:hypothetical protein
VTNPASARATLDRHPLRRGPDLGAGDRRVRDRIGLPSAGTARTAGPPAAGQVGPTIEGNRAVRRATRNGLPLCRKGNGAPRCPPGHRRRRPVASQPYRVWPRDVGRPPGAPNSSVVSPRLRVSGADRPWTADACRATHNARARGSTRLGVGGWRNHRWTRLGCSRSRRSGGLAGRSRRRDVSARTLGGVCNPGRRGDRNSKPDIATLAPDLLARWPYSPRTRTKSGILLHYPWDSRSATVCP